MSRIAQVISFELYRGRVDHGRAEVLHHSSRSVMWDVMHHCSIMV